MTLPNHQKGRRSVMPTSKAQPDQEKTILGNVLPPRQDALAARIDTLLLVQIPTLFELE